MDVDKEVRCAIVQRAIEELRRNAALIEASLPATLTIHLPPKGSPERVVLEIKHKLR